MHASRISSVISRDSKGIVEASKESFLEDFFYNSFKIRVSDPQT
jgi:hypothetical protein